MSDNAPLDSTEIHTRRALVVADSDGLSLQQKLTSNGYMTRASNVANAAWSIGDFRPDIIILIVSHAEGETENGGLALARKLRAETSTYSLPLVFAWSEDRQPLRAAAQYIGADDYFSLSTPTVEILARLDSLFWRVEVGRRSVPVVSDRRLDIDNFMFMLDAVREDARAGASGTLALIYATASGGKGEALDKAVRDHTLAKVQGFLKLNLRRMDAVAYYGPTALLVYLPRMDSRSALAALSRLHREFFEEHADRHIIVGMASFPVDGQDVEGLIEKAEVAVGVARAGESNVVAYEPSVKASSSVQKETASESAVEQAAEAKPQAAEATTVPTEPESASPTVEETAKETAAEETVVEEPVQVEMVHAESEKESLPEAPAAAVRIEATASRTEQPTAEELARASEEAATKERERRAGGAVMPRRLLLTVSDAARMTQINSLIRSAGYEARAAFDGQQALHLLRIEQPDLLLLDYELQGIDGLETIRRLRKQQGGRLSQPVIMLLAAENERARREALELGAHSVHVTPYDPAELLASVRQAGSPE